jgi:tetratricopeptide (TPR) repeat protein
MKEFKYIIICGLLLSACAHAPISNSQPAAVGAVPTSGEPEEQPKAALPNVELNSDLLYEYLVSAIASQRGETALAVDGSLDLAKKTHDPRLAMRATQMAIRANQIDKAIEALRIWLQADPSSQMATRMLSSALLHAGRLDEAKQEFAKVLKSEGERNGQTFVQIYQMLASYSDKAAALKLIRDLSSPYPKVAEAHWAVAQLAQSAGADDLALDEAKTAYSLQPDWDLAASLEATLLQKSSPQQSLNVLSRYLKDHPDAREIRVQYARMLLEQKQYEKSRAEFERLAEDNPDNPDIAYAIALISLQMNDLPRAEAQLKQALEKGKKDQDTVHYYLGQLSETKKDNDEAIAQYREVKGGEYLVSAQIRLAYLLGKQGRIDDAMNVLNQVQASNNQQRVQLVLIEAEIFRQSNRFEDAYRVLQEGSAKFPDNPDVLYSEAMMADKLGKLDVFEQLMRKVIQLSPGYAQAYNALGYGLLERNERIPEAVGLVEKALQLDPDDASIMDSVGWGYYRSGKLDASVKMLRRAFAADPDPEIAAHLGEVLWMRGDKDEAKKTLRDSLKTNPGNATLQTAIKKFDP